MPLPPRAGAVVRELGGPVRPEAASMGTAGPPQSHHTP